MKILASLTMSMVVPALATDANCPKEIWFKGAPYSFYTKAEVTTAKNAAINEVWQCKGILETCKLNAINEVGCVAGKLRVKDGIFGQSDGTDAKAPEDSGVGGWKEYEPAKMVAVPEKVDCDGDAAGKYKGYIKFKDLAKFPEDLAFKAPTAWINADSKSSGAATGDQTAITPADFVLELSDNGKKLKVVGQLEGCKLETSDGGGGGFCKFPCGPGWIIMWVALGVVVVGGVVAVILLSGGEDDEDDDDDEDEDDKDDDE